MMVTTYSSEDQFQIQQQLYRSALAQDFADVELFLSTWTDSAAFEMVIDGSTHRRFEGLTGLRSFCELCRPWGADPFFGLYHVGAILFDTLDGDAARTTSMVISTMQLDGRPTIHSHGRFRDEWQRTKGTWLISHRRFEISGTWPSARPA